MKKENETETAIVAAGCFWGVEETLRQIPGVISTEAGYTGGTVDAPTYEQVCSDQTGHAEAVKIIFDPQKVSYEKILDAFFELHNPTTLNYQGPDFGSQYRSAIFFTTLKQQQAAQKSIDKQRASGKWGGRPIVTQVVMADKFYPAEAYHQKYLMKRGLGSCHI